EDEEVDAVGEEREPDDHLKGPRTQQQPHARGHENADPEGEDEFHQAVSSAARSSSSARSCSCSRRRLARSDWCASAISMSTVAPTTSANTPRSKRSAVAAGTSPI